MATFRGRGVKQAIISTRVLDGGNAVIRIDDERDPEYWAEVRIGRAELVALLAAMDAQIEADNHPIPAGWDHV